MTLFDNLFSSQNVQKENFIHVNKSAFKIDNSFTQSVNQTFSELHWRFAGSWAFFSAPNIFGDITNLIMPCTVTRNGVTVYQFNAGKPYCKAGKSIRLNMSVSNALTTKEAFSVEVLSGGLKHEYKIILDNVMFNIPESNPLYNDPSVREALGLTLDEEKTIKETANIINDLNQLKLNLLSTPKIQLLVEVLEQNTKNIIERFVSQGDIKYEYNKYMEHYLPTIISTLNKYTSILFDNKNIAEAKKAEKDIIELLTIANSVSSKMLYEQAKADVVDVETDISAIKTQLIADGLLDE